MDPSIRNIVGNDVTLIYWDYYTLEQEKYDHMFDSHKKICDKLAFAGGAWKWEGLCPNSWYSQAVAPVAHRSCCRSGIQQVIITAWGDNGDECSLYSVLPAFLQWAELCYNNNDNDELLEARFRTCTGGSYRDFLHLGDASVMPDNPPPGRCGVNPTRALLYQDLLGGLFDAHAEYSQADYLRACARRMEKCRDHAPQRWQYLFETQRILDGLLAEKCTLGLDIRSAYAKRDANGLLNCRKRALALLPCIEALLHAVEEQWLHENKILVWTYCSCNWEALKREFCLRHAVYKTLPKGASRGWKNWMSRRFHFMEANAPIKRWCLLPGATSFQRAITESISSLEGVI